MTFKKPDFKIIRHYGDPTEAEMDGYKIYRQKSIFVKEYNRFIPCAPYDNHFIFEEPTGKFGRPSFMCTCGSMAVVVGFSGYEKDASSPEGLMFICHNHGTFGVHADRSK